MPILRAKKPNPSDINLPNEPRLVRVQLATRNEILARLTRRLFPNESTAKPLRTFGGFDPALTREIFEDGGDEIRTVAVFRVRHFVNLAD